MNIGKAIAILRIENDLDQRSLSIISCLDKSYISLIESNKRTPSLNSFCSIARVLNIKPSELLAKAESYD